MGHVVSKERSFENVDRRTDDGRKKTDACLYCKLYCEVSAQKQEDHDILSPSPES